MATVIFYGKCGCTDNERQKGLLRQAGHLVEERDIMTHPWSAPELLLFLEVLDVVEWFNRSAPRIRSGEFDPRRVDRKGALRLLLLDPELIRRPLMQVGSDCRVGFDPLEVDAWIGLGPGSAGSGFPPFAGGKGTRDRE